MPGLGAGSGKFQVSVGWRYAKASRSYFNSRLNHNFTDLWKPVFRLSILDVTARYKLNNRTSILATVPIVMNRFSMIFPPLSPSRGQRHGWPSTGVGDLAVYSETLVLNPKSHPFENISLGVGMKFPTGNWDVKALIPDETGRNLSKRAVFPPAIMPGDGGVGVIVGFQAYKTFRHPWLSSSSFYTSGSYLINPRNTNATRSIISNLGVPLTPNFLGRLTNSVADGYSLSAGFSWRPPYVWEYERLKGLRLLSVIKYEGLNTRDLIGENDGFRQPGYALAAGPGIAYSYKRDSFIAEMPIVFNRHINPGATALPGLPVRGGPSAFNPNRQMGLVAPLSLSLRYVRSF